MLAAEILRSLPGSLPSAVVFRLDALRPLADDALLRHMFMLPESPCAGLHTHVVLTPLGPLLATPSLGQLHLASTGAAPVRSPGEDCLLARFEDRLALLPSDEPDCLGVGQLPGLPPVGLHVRISGLDADGVASFSQAPPPRSLDLLRAVGVEYRGGREVGDSYVVMFHNRLDQHLLAGALGGFRRTDNCNLFFMQHGVVGPELERGLLDAATARIAHGRAKLRASLMGLAESALTRPLALTCVPPAPESPGPYGDLVPLGFVLAALPAGETADRVRHLLTERCRGGLWSFHTGGLPTATDTSLIARAMGELPTLLALEKFRDDDGGYVPQLWSVTAGPDRMEWREENQHWCQPDFATTSLVVAGRRRAGLPVARSLRWLAEHVQQRRSLFFANPFLVDWALADALSVRLPVTAREEEQPCAEIRARLRIDLLAAQHPDGSFGAYDQALSTSLAILALDHLGERGRPLLQAQLRLLDWLSSDGHLPVATPFFSSLQSGVTDESLDPSDVVVGGRHHAITFYRDDVGLITTALAVEALSVPTPGAVQGATADVAASRVPGRYRCPDATAYIRDFVLNPPPVWPAPSPVAGGSQEP